MNTKFHCREQFDYYYVIGRVTLFDLFPERTIGEIMNVTIGEIKQRYNELPIDKKYIPQACNGKLIWKL